MQLYYNAAILCHCRKDYEKTKEEASKLAILKHQNIVQYFNSGLGSTPTSWDGWRDWIEKKRRYIIIETITV